MVLGKKSSSKRLSISSRSLQSDPEVDAGVASKFVEQDLRKRSQKEGVCPDCGIKTHNVSRFNREPLKNEDVHFGTCINCKPDSVPRSVRKEWEKRNEVTDEQGLASPTSSKDDASGVHTTVSDHFEDKDLRKRAKKEGLCADCGVRTHKVSGRKREALKNDDVHYGSCIRCQPECVPPSVLKEWESRHADDEEYTTDAENMAAHFEEKDLRKRAKKAGMCPDCGIQTHDVSGFKRKALKNDDVHYGSCIKCNPDGVPPSVLKDWQTKQVAAESEDESLFDAESESQSQVNQSVSSHFIAKDIQKRAKKEGICPDCGVRTHDVKSFKRKAIKNDDVHYGTCIKCKPDGVPPSVLKEWEEKQRAGEESSAAEDVSIPSSASGKKNEVERTPPPQDKPKGSPRSRDVLTSSAYDNISTISFSADDLTVGGTVKGVHPTVVAYFAAKDLRKRAEKAGICPSCGLNTHKVSGSKREALKNEDVHYGTCIKCKPEAVPRSVRKEYEERQKTEEEEEESKSTEEEPSPGILGAAASYLFGSGAAASTESAASVTSPDEKQEVASASHVASPLEAETLAMKVHPSVAAYFAEKDLSKRAKKKGLCSECGIRTHDVSGLKPKALKTEDVHFGTCIRCKPDSVPRSVLKKWEEEHGESVAEESAEEKSVRSAEARAKLQAQFSSKDLGKRAKKKGLCPGCGIQTHNTSGFKSEALKNDDVHYGVCIKCNPDGVLPRIRKEWEDKQEATDAEEESSSGVSASVVSHIMVKDLRKRAFKEGICPDCGRRTHKVSGFKKEPLKNEYVHYGTCINCNIERVPASVRREFEEEKKEELDNNYPAAVLPAAAAMGAAAALPPSLGPSPSYEFSTDEEDAAEMHASRTKGASEMRDLEMVSSPSSAAGGVGLLGPVGIASSFDDEPEDAFVFENKDANDSVVAAQKMTPPKRPSNPEAKPTDSSYLTGTFKVPPNVAAWLEESLDRDDISSVVLAAASGKRLSSFVRPKRKSSSRRRKSSHRRRSSQREAAATDQDVADLRAELTQMKKEMKQFSTRFDASATEADSDV